jgi:hypothetical protein
MKTGAARFSFRRRPWTQTQASNSDLKNELDHGRTIAEIACFLCWDVYEVRAIELGSVEQPVERIR